MVLVKATDDSEKGILPRPRCSRRWADLMTSFAMPASCSPPTASSPPRRASVLRSMVPAARSSTGRSPKPGNSTSERAAALCWREYGSETFASHGNAAAFGAVSVLKHLVRRRGAQVGAGIFAGGRYRQPAKVMRPTLGVAGALCFAGKTAMGHAQQGAAVAVDQIDLDQAGSRRHFLIALPTKTVGEAVDRHDLAERAARSAAAVDAFEKIEPARMHLGLGLRSHPAHDLFGIGQEGEHGGGWGCDMGLALNDERFGHRSLLDCGCGSPCKISPREDNS